MTEWERQRIVGLAKRRFEEMHGLSLRAEKVIRA
jgi:hypothetical protein